LTTFPPFDPSFLDALEKWTIENWEGVVWRVTIGDTPVLRTNTGGARWNPPEVEVLYSSLNRDAAIAEVEFRLNQQPIPVRTVRRVSRLRVKLARVIDLSTAEAAESIGHTLSELAADDLTIAQRIGAAIEWLEIGGLLVPSARFIATNLVVYMKNFTPPSDLLDVEETVDRPPPGSAKK
jgi:RES domain-containing protein